MVSARLGERMCRIKQPWIVISPWHAEIDAEIDLPEIEAIDPVHRRDRIGIGDAGARFNQGNHCGCMIL